MILVSASRSYSTQAVGSNESHLVLDSPSVRFSLVSPPPEFSSLARTSVTWLLTLPGNPPLSPPSTPDDRLVPSAAVSTVFSQVGAGSPVSNEELNSRSARGCWPGDAADAPW